MRLKIFLTMILAGGFITGCYNDVIKPVNPNAPPQNVSFSGDLQPIFNASCASSGCHDANPVHQPSLIPENAYNSLKAGGFINTTIPTESILYEVLKTGQMPTTGALKSTDVQKVLDWIRLGAPNN